MAKLTKAWKVVRTTHVPFTSYKDDGVRLVSAIALIGVNYEVGQWTYPLRYGNQFLFVFRTRKHARQFVEENFSTGKRHKIYSCLARNATLEREGASGDRPFHHSHWPNGTMFADAVKLLKRV